LRDERLVGVKLRGERLVGERLKGASVWWGRASAGKVRSDVGKNSKNSFLMICFNTDHSFLP
jgi:hypothetical protein